MNTLAPSGSAATDIFQAFPFNCLPAQIQSTMAAHLNSFTFDPGDNVLVEGELPSFVHFVIQGRIRILGSEADQFPTLGVYGPGSVIGWDSLVRRVATGSARAAGTQPTKTLALTADIFEDLAVRHFLPHLVEQVTVAELYDSLSQFLSLFAIGLERQAAEFVRRIEQENLAIALNPHSLQGDSQLPTDRIWLTSSRSTKVEIGTRVTHAWGLQPTLGSPFPMRLIGVQRSFLEKALATGDLTSSHQSLTVPDEMLSQAQAAINLVDAEVSQHQPPIRSDHLPIHRGREPDEIEDWTACFWMLADRLKVPFRPDLLRQWLRKRERISGDRLNFYSRLAEVIGLDTKLIKFTASSGGLKRLQFPAVVLCNGVPGVLYEIVGNQVTVASPRTGLHKVNLDAFVTQIDKDGAEAGISMCQAMVLERQPGTPVKTFGVDWFLPRLKKHQGVLIQVLIASVFVQLLGLANPLLVQQIVDKVIINSSPGALPTFGALMLIFTALEAILTVLRQYLLASTTNRIDLVLASEIVKILVNQPLDFFGKRPVGELSTRLSELENIRQFLTSTALSAVLDVVFSFLYVGVMLLYSVQLTLCVLAFIPVIIGLTLFVSSILQKRIRIKADQHSLVQSYLIEVLSGIFTVKSQNMEFLVQGTWKDRYINYLETGFKVGMINTVFGAVSNLLNTLSSLLVLWVGAGLILSGSLSLGGLIAFRIIAGYVVGPMVRLARLWQRFQEVGLSMELLADIVESPTEVLPEDANKLALPPVQGYVQFQSISFGFKPGQLQLSNVSVEVMEGAFVGVVGQSGSGKSTLVKLLPRLYIPNQGQIYIDGYDISKVHLPSLRRQIGIVPQDSILFEGSIRENITLFSDQYSDEEVMEAAKIADAHDFIMTLAQGYSTQVGERGSALSGGQRQRIAIARMVLQNPNLLILDEATSALDYTTENRVCMNLAKKFKGRTVFFITHRLNTIRNADLILLMDQGCLVEQGTHSDLMALQGRYYCLFEQQNLMSA